jgi:hypothetical protein
VSKNPLEGVPGAGRQGDAIVDGLKHEFKSLGQGADSNTIRNVINKSKNRGGQARDWVLDARNTGRKYLVCHLLAPIDLSSASCDHPAGKPAPMNRPSRSRFAR